MVTTNKAITVLRKYKNTLYEPMVKYDPSKKDVFKTDSYARYCIDEIIKRLEENEERPFRLTPIDVLDDYREELDSYQCSASTEDLQVLFATMYDTATEMIDILIMHF